MLTHYGEIASRIRYLSLEPVVPAPLANRRVMEEACFPGPILIAFRAAPPWILGAVPPLPAIPMPSPLAPTGPAVIPLAPSALVARRYRMVLGSAQPQRLDCLLERLGHPLRGFQ